MDDDFEHYYNATIRLEAVVSELKEALKADASDLWDVTNAIRKVIKSYEWIQEGRGSYAWDDDEYRKEAGRAFDEILNLICTVQHPAQKRFHNMMKLGQLSRE